MQKGAISFKATKTADKGTAWDGPAEVAAASIDDLKIMCAWVDGENAENKGAYKLPHHRASDHAVVWRGVTNAMARLSQTQIPDTDKKAVFNHLAKHYAQFDEEPPEAKELQSNDTIDKHYLEATITKANDGSFVAIASTNSVDRHGEVVDNNGWELKAFKKNPVILWAHDHTEPAIGVAKKVWVEGTGKKAQLMIQPILHDITDKAKAIKQLVEQGIIRSLSVGFRPLESPDGVTYSKNELLEVSMVNVPANADAMMMAYKTLKASDFEDEVIKDIGIPVEVVDKLTTMENDIAELKTLVKAQLPVNPHVSRQRLSMLKVVAKASDKLLEAEKKQIVVDRKDILKVIKRATEILTVAEKEDL